MKETTINYYREYYQKQGLTERQIKNRLKKESERIEAQKNQKPVKSINMVIEWKKSRTWGYNPHLTATIYFADGTSERYNTTASGCGYDKESTVISHVFNEYLKYKLFPKIEGNEIPHKPYGISYYAESESVSYSYGIGTSCYYAIAQFLDGKMKQLAHTDNVSVYQVEFN